MGVSNNDGLKAKGKGRGATNVARSLAGLGQGGNEPASADYATVNWTWMSGVVIEVTRRGGAVSLGLSRDRGAYNVTIFLDGDRKTVWISSSEDVDAKVEEILHFVASLPD